MYLGVNELISKKYQMNLKKSYQVCKMLYIPMTKKKKLEIKKEFANKLNRPTQNDDDNFTVVQGFKALTQTWMWFK